MDTGNEKQLIESIRDLTEAQAGSYKQQREISELLRQHFEGLKETKQKIEIYSAILLELKAMLPYLPKTEDIQVLAKELAAGRRSAADLTKQLEVAAANIPQQVSVEVRHRLEGRAKGFVLTLAAALLITALSVSLWISGWRERRRLEEQDIKYRYLILAAPEITLHVDSLYLHNQEGFTDRVRRLKWKEQQLRQAEREYDQKQQEAAEAGRKLKKLKK